MGLLCFECPLSKTPTGALIAFKHSLFKNFMRVYLCSYLKEFKCISEIFSKFIILLLKFYKSLSVFFTIEFPLLLIWDNFQLITIFYFFFISEFPLLLIWPPNGTEHLSFLLFHSEFHLLLIWDHYTNKYHRFFFTRKSFLKLFLFNFIKEFLYKLIGDLQQKILQKNSL